MSGGGVREIGETRGGNSHRRRSHGCDRGQEAVKGSRAVFGVGQAVKILTFCACILHIV